MGGWLKAGAIAGLVLFVCALVAVVLIATQRRDRSEECRFNLKRMWTALSAAEKPSSKEWDEMPTGRSFWDRAEYWPGAQIPIDRANLVCPVLDRTAPGPGPDRIDYRGPARSLRLLGPDDPVAADRNGNHLERGFVILRSGTMPDVDDRLWRRAAETTAE